MFKNWQKLRTGLALYALCAGLALHAMRTGLALHPLRARLDLQPSGAISLPSTSRRIMCIKHNQSAIVSTDRSTNHGCSAAHGTSFFVRGCN